MVVGLARGRRARRDRSRVLGRPDECPAPGIAEHSASRPCALSRPYCAEHRALGSVLTFAPTRSGSGSLARCGSGA